MKALVLEKRGEKAAVLREDGLYDIISQPCEEGDTVELNAEILGFPAHRKAWVRSAVAAAMALVVFTSSYSYLNTTASAYVSLDVGETGVEVAVNHLGRVISVTPMNDTSAETARVLTEDMKGRKMKEALPEAIGRLSKEGLLQDSDAFMIVGVTAGSEDRVEAMKTAVEQSSKDAGNEEVEVITFEVSRDDRKEAVLHEMSGGRFVFERSCGGPGPEGIVPPDEAEAPEEKGQAAEENTLAEVPEELPLPGSSEQDQKTRPSDMPEPPSGDQGEESPPPEQVPPEPPEQGSFPDEVPPVPEEDGVPMTPSDENMSLSEPPLPPEPPQGAPEFGELPDRPDDLPGSTAGPERVVEAPVG